MFLGYQTVRLSKISAFWFLANLSLFLCEISKPKDVTDCTYSFLPYTNPGEDKTSLMSCRAPEKSKPAMICNVKKCEGNLVCQNCLTDLTHVKIDSVNCESYSRMDDSTTQCIYDNNYFTCSGECTGGAQCSECEVEVTGQTSSSSSNKNSASQATTGGNGVKTWLSWR